MDTRVYIGRLHRDCRESDVLRFFKNYGKVREVLMKNGFGFVEFEDNRDADDAVYELNGKTLLGERVILEIARGPMRRNNRFGGGGGGFSGGGGSSSGGGNRRRGGWVDKYGPIARTEYRLVVSNLSSRVSWQDLKDYMRQAGEVTYADAHKEKRNEGVVEFASYTDMKNAMHKLNDTELNGRRIKIVEQYRGRRRSRSRSSSRSRSKSRSRSRGRRSRESRSRSRSRSRSPSRSRSATPRRDDDKSRMKSKSRSRSRTPERSRSRERTPSRDRTPIDNGEGSTHSGHFRHDDD